MERVSKIDNSFPFFAPEGFLLTSAQTLMKAPLASGTLSHIPRRPSLCHIASEAMREQDVWERIQGMVWASQCHGKAVSALSNVPWQGVAGVAFRRAAAGLICQETNAGF